jgi:hypothetical protein
MTTPITNPAITIHKIFQTDTVGSLLSPVYAFFELLTESFTMPNLGDQVTLKVVDSTKYHIGMAIYIAGIGFLDVVGISDATHLYLQNNGTDGNESAGVSVPVGTVFLASAPRPASETPLFYLTDTLAQAFTVPTGTANGSLYVANPSWYKVGMQVFIPGAGFFRITTYDSGTNLLTVKNVGQDNVTGGTVIAAGSTVNPQQCSTMDYNNSPLEQEGVLAGQTLSANNYPGEAVTFPTAFATAPTNIQVTMHSSGDPGSIGKTQICVTAITTTGFSIVWDSDITSTVSFHWRARK